MDKIMRIDMGARWWHQGQHRNPWVSIKGWVDVLSLPLL